MCALNVKIDKFAHFSAYFVYHRIVIFPKIANFEQK